MPVRVLIADNDLDIHKLITDLLPILFKKVTIDKALNSATVIKKLSDPGRSYDLCILDLSISDAGGRDVLLEIGDRFPQLLSRILCIVDSPDIVPQGAPYDKIPRLVKPFSLDEFGELAKKMCAG